MSEAKTALISVADKSGIEHFAKSLSESGVRIIATGGTYQYLEDHQIHCCKVEDITGFPDLFDGRVKTLHPSIMGGILANRSQPSHISVAHDQNIPLIDIVVVNLYPFERVVSNINVAESDAIENIDIGGATLIRAAGKNYHSVYVVTDPKDYDSVLEGLKSENGALQLRKRLAEKAFMHTAYYDAIISAYLHSQNPTNEDFPSLLPGGFRKLSDLRYGENPHQKAALYRDGFYRGVSLANSTIHSGKEISYNNINDLEAVLGMLLDFDNPFAVIVKHTNPCGAACGDNLAEAYADALACDEMSAFGGIVGLNQMVDLQTAKLINDTFFLECILAPDYEPEALELLTQKKNRRVISCGKLKDSRFEAGWERKHIMGGLLLQFRDDSVDNPGDFRIVTEQQPTDEQYLSLKFANIIAKHIKSNAIVIVDKTRTVGIGAGQTSRVDSAVIAVRKAAERARGSVAASDAFFPMADGLETLAKAGIKAIIQPGGSKKDAEVIEMANRYGISMVFTGKRHFRH